MYQTIHQPQPRRLPDAPDFSLYTPFKSKSGGCTNHVQITAPRSHKSYCTLRLVSMSKQNIYWNIEITDGVSHTDKKMGEISTRKIRRDCCKVKYEEGPSSMWGNARILGHMYIYEEAVVSPIWLCTRSLPNFQLLFNSALRFGFCLL
jgi:hypothetical protein